MVRRTTNYNTREQRINRERKNSSYENAFPDQQLKKASQFFHTAPYSAHSIIKTKSNN